MDNAPAVPNATQDDFDHDGIADACDWCITIPNGPETEVALPQNGLPPICLPGGCTFPGDGFFGGRNLRLAEWPIYGTGAHGRFATAKPKNLARIAPQGLPASVPETFTRILKQKEYELSDHLGNVRVTFSDVKQLTGAPNAPPYKVDLQTYANYYPFGMQQPMRSYPDPGAAAVGSGAGTTYRYGYNGKEMDNEWYGDAGNGLSGVGNSYDYGFRIYNPRYARFLSVDPLTDKLVGLSPYAYAANNPIQFIEEDGLRPAPSNKNHKIIADIIWNYGDNVYYQGRAILMAMTSTGSNWGISSLWRYAHNLQPNHERGGIGVFGEAVAAMTIERILWNDVSIAMNGGYVDHMTWSSEFHRSDAKGTWDFLTKVETNEENTVFELKSNNSDRNTGIKTDFFILSPDRSLLLYVEVKTNNPYAEGSQENTLRALNEGVNQTIDNINANFRDNLKNNDWTLGVLAMDYDAFHNAYLKYKKQMDFAVNMLQNAGGRLILMKNLHEASRIMLREIKKQVKAQTTTEDDQGVVHTPANKPETEKTK